MATLCPSCNKFAGLEMQEPEVNEVNLNVDNTDLDSATVTYSVRIIRNSSCCGDEMKESSFDGDADVPENIIAKMKEIVAANADAEFDVEEGNADPLEEGGSRYKKSYFGFNLSVDITHDGQPVGSFDITDKVQASGMDDLV